MDQVWEPLSLHDPSTISMREHLGGSRSSTEVVMLGPNQHGGTHFLDNRRNEASQIGGGQTLDGYPSAALCYFRGRGRKHR